MRELRAGQRAHALQSQVAQVCLTVLQELAQLVAGTDKQVGLAARNKGHGERGIQAGRAGSYKKRTQ